jgi:hypothetical protein
VQRDLQELPKDIISQLSPEYTDKDNTYQAARKHHVLPNNQYLFMPQSAPLSPYPFNLNFPLTKILMNINRQIPSRIPQLGHKLARGLKLPVRSRRLRERMSARPCVAWCEDELAGTGLADGVDGGLVVCEDELGCLCCRKINGWLVSEKLRRRKGILTMS